MFPLATFTYDEAVELLDIAVQERGGDYVYKRNSAGSRKACQYTRDGKPSCIMGLILYYQGVSIEDLSDLDDLDCAGIDSLIRNGVVGVEDRRTKDLLLTAQWNQDGLDTWGEAVRKAKAATSSVAVA